MVVDISDPNNMKAVSHIDMPMSVSGTGGDNIDVTKVETTGMVYYSGYAAIQPGTPSQTVMPYAFYNAGVQVFDLKDPNKPTIGLTLCRKCPASICATTAAVLSRASIPTRCTAFSSSGTAT